MASPRPTKSRQRYLALGIAASMGLAGALGAALEMFDPVPVMTRQTEAAGDIPVLGTVGPIA